MNRKRTRPCGCVIRDIRDPCVNPGHVFLDHGHRDVARAFVHDLHAFGPDAAGEFAKLGFIVGVGNRVGAEAVALMPMII